MGFRGLGFRISGLRFRASRRAAAVFLCRMAPLHSQGCDGAAYPSRHKVAISQKTITNSFLSLHRLPPKILPFKV